VAQQGRTIASTKVFSCRPSYRRPMPRSCRLHPFKLVD